MFDCHCVLFVVSFLCPCQVNTRGNGLTLALTDLGKVETTLDSNMVALTALLSQQMSATPGG